MKNGELVDEQTKGINLERNDISEYYKRTVGNSNIFIFMLNELFQMFIIPLPGALGYGLRRFLLPLLIKKIDRRSIISRNVIFRGVDKIEIGKEVLIDENTLIDALPKSRGIKIGNRTTIERFVTLHTGNFEGAFINIGDHCSIACATQIYGYAGVTIEDHVMIGGHSYIIAASHIPDKRNFTSERGHRGKGVRIGKNVWCGAGVIILDGVEIGENSIIGAGAVVNKNIPADSVAVGVPARVIRKI